MMTGRRAVADGAPSNHWKRANSAALLLSASWILCSVSAHAQVVPQTGGTLSDQFDEPELPQSQVVEPFRIQTPRDPSPQIQQQAFLVRQITIDGAEQFPTLDLSTLTNTVEGREVTLGELNALASQITGRLAREGYALSFAIVPEQIVEDGMVRLRIVQGTIDAIEIQFDEGSLPVGRARIEGAIRERLSRLVANGAVRTAELERAVLGINDLSGITVSVVISPSESVEGAATLQVMVDTDRYNLLVGSDNRLRDEYGNEQIYAVIAVNSLLFVGDSLEVSARTGFDTDAFSYFSGAYETSLGRSLARARVHYSTAQTEAQSGALRLLEFDGEEQTWGASLSYPIIRSRARTLTASLAFDGTDTQSNLFGVPVVDENIRTFSARVSYDWASGDGALSLFSVGLTKGISGLGATGRNNPLRSRSAGNPDATFANFRLYRNQPLPAGFYFRYNGEAQLQISSGGLQAANECTFGGPAIGRAYDAGFLSGDDCLLVSAEIARPSPVASTVIEPYAYFDWGRAYQRGRLSPGERSVSSAESFGLGLRIFARIGLRADVQLAFPTDRAFPGDDRNPRLFFTISFQR